MASTPTATADSQTPAPQACQPLAQHGNRPSYRFWVESDPVSHRLNIRQQIALAYPVRLQTGEIALNTPANHAPGIFDLSTVQIAGVAAPIQFDLTDAALRVTLPSTAPRAEAVTLCLNYTLTLPPAGEQEISGAHALAWSSLGDVAGYWYPMLAPFDPVNGWRLIAYHPVGDPILLESADYDITVQAPPGYTVIGSGFVGMEDGFWHFALRAARGVALVISDQLMLTAANAGDIPVRVYHRSDHAPAAQAAAQAIIEALPLLTEAYGPYPYDEANVVEAVQFGGMEYTGLITFSSSWFAGYQPPLADETFGADYVVRFVVHELGHQWWYGAVGNDQANEPWLDESLARYGEWRYYATLYPEHLAWWEAPSKGMATQPINQPIYAFDDTLSYVQAVYVSGTRFLLAVQEQIGEDAFDAFLQDHCARNRNRIVTGDEFLTALQEHTDVALADLLPVYFAPMPGQPTP